MEQVEHDLVLHGGKIVTLDASSRIVCAIGVKGGRISAAGEVAEVLKGCSPFTKVLDVSGKTVTPGFFDGHPHMDRAGLRQRGGIPLDGCHSIADIQEVIREAASRTPSHEWIVLMPMGRMLDYVYRPDQLAEGRFPDRHDLDKAAPHNPVYIRPPWGWWTHRPLPAIANTRALEVAGINRQSAPPYKVEMLADGSGDPTGIFLDYNFSPLLEFTLMSCVPRFTYEDRVHSARAGAAVYSAAGTTSGYEGHGVTPALMHAYREVHAAGELSVRVQLPLSVPTSAFDMPKIADMLFHWSRTLGGRGQGDDVLRLEGICLDLGDPEASKVIAGGFPYDQWAGHYRQALSYDRLVEIGLLAARLGLRVNCCVPSDMECVIRAFEAINAQIPIVDRRWVMIHVVEATPDQLRRMKALGVVVTVNPNFMYMAGDRFELGKLGERGTPIRQLIDAGIPTALSTDNVPPSMLFAMGQALTRWDNDSQTSLGESRLTREEALRLSTLAGHWLTWQEESRGSLGVGNVADIAVLDGDPLTCEANALKSIKVERCFLAGRQVFAQ
ncbi:MAG TPA: amidohydrolase family protein [Bradyrhizobium sp.]|nr:amidohydrolase family protein [Bradyrhizobium sp.]